MHRRLEKEMGQYKFNSYFLSEYEIRQRRNLRRYDVFVALISGFTALITVLKEIFFPANSTLGRPAEILQIASVIAVFLTTISRYLLPIIVPNQSRLSKIAEYQQFYTTNYNKLEKIWLDHNQGMFDEKQISDLIYPIIESETKINTGVNEVVKSIPDDLELIARKEALEYLKLFDKQKNKHNGGQQTKE